MMPRHRVVGLIKRFDEMTDVYVLNKKQWKARKPVNNVTYKARSQSLGTRRVGNVEGVSSYPDR